MREVLSVLAGLIVFYGYIPYSIDIVRGKVKPARSARLMFTLLLVVTLLQQNALHSGWLLAVTFGEAIGTIGILLLAIKHGVGGLSVIDRFCYVLLAVDILLWLSTGNTLLALHLSVLADIIAFTPTLVKSWRQPWTETPLFFMLGSVAPLLNILAVGNYAYGVLLFPAYLFLANLVEVIIILERQKRIAKPAS